MVFKIEKIPSFRLEYCHLSGLEALKHITSSDKIEVSVYGRLRSTYYIDMSKENSHIDHIRSFFEFLNYRAPYYSSYFENFLGDISKSDLWKTVQKCLSNCYFIDFSDVRHTACPNTWTFNSKSYNRNGDCIVFRLCQERLSSFSYSLTYAGQHLPAEKIYQELSFFDAEKLIYLIRLTLLANIFEGYIPKNKDIRYVTRELHYRNDFVHYCINNKLI